MILYSHTLTFFFASKSPFILITGISYTYATNGQSQLSYLGLPGAQLVQNPPAIQEIPVGFQGREVPLEKGQATLSRILAWRIPMDIGAWRATVHGVAKSRTRPATERRTAHATNRDHRLQKIAFIFIKTSHICVMFIGHSYITQI